MSDKYQIITVDIGDMILSGSTYRPKYAVLMNRTRQQIVAFARAHPKVFVFPFVSLPPESCPDYRWLRRKDCAIRDHIVQPMDVGNLKPMDEAIRQIIVASLRMALSECDEVKDDIDG